MFDHPLRHGEARCAGGLPRDAALGRPRERTILAIAQRGAMQRRVAAHQALDALDVIGVDGMLELRRGQHRLDVSLKFRPTRKLIEPGNLELCGSECFGGTGLQ
jgi:hypothetical protein